MLLISCDQWQKNEVKVRDPYNKITFGRMMVQHGFKESRNQSFPRVWKGIRLKTSEELALDKIEQEKSLVAFKPPDDGFNSPF